MGYVVAYTTSAGAGTVSAPTLEEARKIAADFASKGYTNMTIRDFQTGRVVEHYA
jgi:hypothetical protein